MKSKWSLFGLVFIVIVAAVLRLSHLSSIPPGINRDEGSIGFTAYSLLKTGADEYGRHLPLSFESFGDWKLPLYIYTTVPFVSLFGLNELAVRLPSALFGIGSVLLIFFIARELLKNDKLALLASFLAAITPWSVHLSRVESESNTAVFLLLLGLLLFFKSMKRAWLVIPSVLFFALTYYTYAGNHVFTTLFLFGLLLIYRKEIKISNHHKIAAVLFVLLSGVIFYQTLLGGDRTKLSGIGIFGDPSVVHAQIEIPRNEHSNPNSLFARVIHNRIVFGGERFVQNYLNSFAPQFLFISGGTNRAHNIQNFGNMYLAEAVFFYLGFGSLLFNKKTKEKKLILLWLLIGPIAASITKDAPHTNRMFAVFPALPIATVLGIEQVFLWVHSKNMKKVFMIGLTLVLGLNFLIYLDRYFVHFPKDEAINWGIGYKQLNVVLNTPQFAQSHVVITQPQTSPYIFLLFYSQFDPKTYQKEAIRYLPTEDGFVHVKAYDRFEFRDINWTTDLNSGKLLVAAPQEVPLNIKNSYTKETVSLPDGEIQFLLIQK